jgi:hypothetical protein
MSDDCSICSGKNDKACSDFDKSHGKMAVQFTKPLEEYL